MIQSKGAGYNFEVRYQEMVLKYLEKKQKQSRRAAASEEDERFLHIMKGENIYRAYDRGKRTDAADVRTMKKFLRDLGAIDDEDMITHRGQQLLSGGSLLDFLRNYIPRVKFVSPQSKNKSPFKQGGKQVSYGAYRSRMYLMILYAAHRAQELGVSCITDDIALTSCRFWPLEETVGYIDESKIKILIDRHFKNKLAGNFDYESLFTKELAAAMDDSKCKRLLGADKKRKFRNAADLVTNYFRMLQSLGLISQVTIEDPNHWSLSQFKDHKTGAVPTRAISITQDGINTLNSLILKTPVWFIDIWQFFEEIGSAEITRALKVINSLSSNSAIPIPANDKVRIFLTKLGAQFRVQDNSALLTNGLDFEWSYDLHSTGKMTKSLLK